MQPDDPNITPVSTAAAATAFRIFLVLVVLMGHTFLLGREYLAKFAARLRNCYPIIRCYSGLSTRVQYFANSDRFC